MLNVALLIGLAVLQSIPCPPELKLELDRHVYAERFSITSASSQDDVPVYLRFKGTGGTWYVSLDFRPKKAGAYRGHLEITNSTSFRPTAVCRRAGMSDTFYVAGWDSTNGDPIVEEWTIGSFSLAAAAGPSGVGTTTMSTPIVRRKNVMLRQGLAGPIQSIACNPLTNELYLLESNTPKILHTLDLAAKQISTSTDATVEPGLSGRRHMNIAQGPTAGFCLVFREQPKWHKPTNTSTRDLYVKRDVDLNGTWDIVDLPTIDDWAAQFPPGSWDAHYQ